MNSLGQRVGADSRVCPKNEGTGLPEQSRERWHRNVSLLFFVVFAHRFATTDGTDSTDYTDFNFQFSIFNSQFAACRTCFAHRLHRLTQIFVLFGVSGVFGNIKSRCRCSFVMGRCDISEVAKHHILGRNYSNYFNFFPIKAHRCSCRHGGYFTGRHGSLPLQSGTIMLQRQCCYTERAMILYGKSIAPRAVGQCSMGYKSSALWGIKALLRGG